MVPKLNRGMRVVVTGGRDYKDQVTLYAKLDLINGLYAMSMVSHGGCEGADTLTTQWCINHGVLCTIYPKRMGEMLELAKPDMVIAFPGHAGTDHCVMLAQQLNITVIHVRKA